MTVEPLLSLKGVCRAIIYAFAEWFEDYVTLGDAPMDLGPPHCDFLSRCRGRLLHRHVGAVIIGAVTAY